MVVSTIGNPRPPFGDMRRGKMIEEGCDRGELHDDFGWDMPSSSSYAMPGDAMELECRSQGLRIVSESGAGLGGLTEEAHPMHRMFPDTNVY